MPNGFLTRGYPVWSTSCTARGGHSGGPVVKEGERKVRGLLVEGDEGHGVVLPVRAIREVLLKHGIRRRA